MFLSFVISQRMDKGVVIGFCVFEAMVGADGYCDWEFRGVASTLEKAHTIIAEFVEPDGRCIHPSMNRSNHYTYVGTRMECANNQNIEEHDFPGYSMGYVIEAHPLQ